MDPLVDITDVGVIGEQELRLTFEDGTVGDVPFTDRAWRGVFEPLADPTSFAQVRVVGDHRLAERNGHGAESPYRRARGPATQPTG